MTDVPLDDIISVLDQYRNAQLRVAEWQEVMASARSYIENALGENETGTIDGEPVVRWSKVTSNRVNQSILKADYPDVYRACISPQTARRFTLVEVTP